MTSRTQGHSKIYIFKEAVKIGRDIMLYDFVLMFVVGLLGHLAPVVGVVLNKKVFSVVSAIYQSRQYDHALSRWLLLFGFYLLAMGFYKTYYHRFFVQFKSLLRFEERIKCVLHKKCFALSNDDFERPQLYTYVKQAQNASINLYRLVEIAIHVVCLSIGSLVVTLYIASFNIWFMAFILVSILPTVAERVIETRYMLKFWGDVAQLQREEKAYRETLIAPVFFKETRVLGATAFLKGKWRNSLSAVLNQERLIDKKTERLRAVTGVIKVLGNNFGFVLGAYLYMTHAIPLEAFMASVAAYATLNRNYTELFNLFAYFNQFSTLVQPFFDFLNTPNRPVHPDTPYSFDTSIELRDVSFKYPSSETNALEQLTLKIEKGAHIAIVGENGAGKSTLANLILGLYLPQSGAVLYDGKSISGVSEHRLYADKTAVFQKFNKYHLSLDDNVRLGNLGCASNRACVEDILQDLFCKHPSLSGTSLLGTAFGGIELSGGEWQKIASARGLYKPFEMAILDEPTSAIDPLKENEMHRVYKTAMCGKTSIMITHRLGAIKRGDRVLVLDKGRIIEDGAHEMLLKEKGRYYEMWTAQAELYTKGKESVFS